MSENDNGSGQSKVRYYTRAPGSDDPWNQLVVDTGPVTVIPPSGGDFLIGDCGWTVDSGLNGSVQWAQVYQGLEASVGGGVLVHDFDPSRDAVAGAPSFQSSTTDDVWELNTDGQDTADPTVIAGDDVRPYDRWIFPAWSPDHLHADYSPALDIIGEQEWIGLVSRPDWVPGGSAYPVLMSTSSITTAQAGTPKLRFYNPSGQAQFIWWDGTAYRLATSPVLAPVLPVDVPLFFSVRWDDVAMAVQFRWAPFQGDTNPRSVPEWHDIGAPVVAGFPLTAGAQGFGIGNKVESSGAIRQWDGEILGAWIYDGLIEDDPKCVARGRAEDYKSEGWTDELTGMRFYRQQSSGVVRQMEHVPAGDSSVRYNSAHYANIGDLSKFFAPLDDFTLAVSFTWVPEDHRSWEYVFGWGNGNTATDGGVQLRNRPLDENSIYCLSGDGTSTASSGGVIVTPGARETAIVVIDDRLRLSTSTFPAGKDAAKAVGGIVHAGDAWIGWADGGGANYPWEGQADVMMWARALTEIERRSLRVLLDRTNK